VAALDQFQRRFALSDARIAAQEDSDAVDLHEHAVDARLGGEYAGKHAGKAAGEFGGRKLRKEQRAVGGVRGLHEQGLGSGIIGKDEAGDGEGKQFFDPRGISLGREFFKVCRFAKPDELDALERETLEETGKRQARTIDVRNRNLACQSFSSRDAAKVEGILFLVVHVQEVKDR